MQNVGFKLDGRQCFDARVTLKEVEDGIAGPVSSIVSNRANMVCQSSVRGGCPMLVDPPQDPRASKKLRMEEPGR